MALTASIIEQITAWCATSDALANIRSKARGEYFGYDEPGEIHYMQGAGDVNTRERRFLGWFSLSFKLPDDRSPAELAAADLLQGSELVPAIDALKRARHVLAVVAMVNPGKGLILRLEDEEFTVENRQLSRLLSRGDALYAHLIPSRHGWLVGPGWFQWPIGIMPGMQAMLKQLQVNPIEMERLLQQRKYPSKDRQQEDLPRDSSLKAAVIRMTEAAKAENRDDLIMTPAQWKKIVLAYMRLNQTSEFGKEIINRTGNVNSVDELNKWLGLAMNIWNNTPQPDRGGKSPFEIRQEYEMG